MSATSTTTDSPYRFADGALHLVREKSDMIIRGWSPPEAKKRTRISPIWEPFCPDFQLVRPRRKTISKSGLSPHEKAAGQMTFEFFSDPIHHDPPHSRPQTPGELRKKALEDFRQSLPVEVAESLEPFKIRQWQMLVMMYYDQGSIDLAISNPALAFYLAQKLDGDVEKIKSLQCSKMRQREIMEFIDCPATKAGVKLISKIHPGSISQENWRKILRIVCSELSAEKTPLRHISQINFGVMEIVNDPAALNAASANLLEEVSKDHREKYRGRVVHMIKSALEMQSELKQQRIVSHFPDMKRLCEVHDRISIQYRRRIRQLNSAQLAAEAGIFQDPPFPGEPGKIEPIICPEQLVDEGESQGNCVASYARRMASGNLYIYRVLHPQRATLSIVKKNRGWVVGELEAKYNSAASKETEKFVADWLRRSQEDQVSKPVDRTLSK